jgi:penicillin-binding protein 2
MLGYVGEVGESELAAAAPNRYYPGDMVGKIGLELQCEDWLRGEDGVRVLEVNAAGTVLGENKELSAPPRPGRDVFLTIDVELQRHLEGMLADFGAGAAVVMDVDDGAIIAAASIPSYDPNRFATGLSQASLTALLEAEGRPLFNRLSQARYPPASTFKVVSAFAILINELIDPGEVLVYCTGARRFGNRVFRCWQEGGHGGMNLLSAVVQSCDVYFYRVGEIMDADLLAAAARAFGFGERTGLDIPGEMLGNIPDRDYYDRKFGRGGWTQGHMLNNVIGQGEYLATVLQVARMCAAVANGGYLVRPHFVDHVDGEAPIAYSKKRVPGLDGATLSFLRRAMEGVVQNPDGTAYWTRLAWLRSAGKTGTAQNPHGEAHAWYTAYAPADAPKIAIAIIVEKSGHGGEFAAPIARDFFARFFESLQEETASEEPGAGAANSVADGGTR